MENPGLTISPCEILNPATLLPTPEGSLPFHSCLETLDHWTKPWEGLSEDPLINPEEIWYTDRSSFVLDWKRRAGYAVVSNFDIIEAKSLPPGQATTCSASSTKIKLQLTTENITLPQMNTAIRTLRPETSKRGRPNTPCRPSSAGSSRRDLDTPIPKELGLPSLEGGMLGS